MATSSTAPEPEPKPAPPPEPSPAPKPAPALFESIPRPTRPYPASLPVSSTFPSSRFVIGAGVAIFHLATARVVVCWHSADRYWFLPKGRRDAGEGTNAGAEREGFEESGYRNRLLPLPLLTRQPRPHNVAEAERSPFVTDPVLMQLAPVRRGCQYVLFWYIAETVPPEVEASLNERMEEGATVENPTPYQYPPKYPEGLTLEERLAMEKGGYEPVHHKNTAVDSEEALYESYLLPVEEAIYRLRRMPLQDEIVRSGWNAICARYEHESETR
ncbi:hypothetical protein MMC11_001354 [Xylographa trunciseda]|nr:hypothetical protein [Xylographa trunciseda]